MSTAVHITRHGAQINLGRSNSTIFDVCSGQNCWRREAVEDEILGAEEGEAGEGEAVGEREEVPGAQGGGGEEKEAGEGAPG
jgi:hypothetical protein